MAAVVTEPRPPRRSLRRRLLVWAPALLLAGLLLTPLILWAAGPTLLAPVEDFAQGPSGAVAYISLYRQLTDQSAQFWMGQDITLSMTSEELDGMISSALLSGRAADAPIRKVRAGLGDGEIQVETVLQFRRPDVPARYQGPIGLNLALRPMMTKQGRIRFQITSASVGRLPIPTWAIQIAGRIFKVQVPGFDTQGPSIALPLGDMVENSLGRRITIKKIDATSSNLSMTLVSPPPTHK